MALRWKILIIVGLLVALADQWTKYLAVKHLTPGIAQAHVGAKTPISRDKTKEVLAELSEPEALGLFFTSVKKPCDGPAAYCPRVEVVKGFWNWRYVENPGAAWGLLANASESVRVPFFFLVSVAAIIFIFFIFRKLEDSQMLMIISLSLVFGGAIGNFIDRLHLSYVIDFIDWYIGKSHWPTFNFADAAITVGVALLIIDGIRESIAERKAKQEGTSAPSAG